LEEWIDLLISSIGYNPDYYSFKAKQYMLMRLVPMVQPRVNLIELAPKGTGKSTVFSKISSNVWLISGGIVTRAQLFYNMKDKIEGILAYYDVIVLDEVQTIKFNDPGEIIGALKGYLQSGEYRVMGHRGTADSGLVILANIKIGIDGKPVNKFVLQELPEFLQETAFIDRFHGLIPGWELPRIEKKSLVNSGYVLRTDYLNKIFHSIRNVTDYSDFVKRHVNSNGDVRDVRSVEQISTGLLKLLYPNIECIGSIENFEKYCVDPSKELRQKIREQMAMKDNEYKLNIAEINVS
jgi:ATP-dependent Lon protease